MPTFDFIPADTLFCRDQKPLAAGSSFGRGANWPLPTVLHSAIRTALLRQLPTGLPPRRSTAGHQRRGVPRGKIASEAYQWLNLKGPFPVDEAGTMSFPIPRDLVPAGEGKVAYLRIMTNVGGNNLPTPLTHLAASFAPPSKATLPQWLPAAVFKSYLAGCEMALPDDTKLWDAEHRIGVRISPDTHTAMDGQLYAAEHLRLRDGVKLRFTVSSPPGHKPANSDEKLNLTDTILQLGGEQRFGRVDPVGDGDLALPHVEVSGLLIKWVLLTPAIFIHGWRPGWVDDTGKVMLRAVDKSKRADRRRPRYSEANWKYDGSKDDAAPISAKLVAACVGKPQVVGGWDVLLEKDGQVTGGGKATQLAVPSGSVYYFRADSPADGARLVKALQARCRSDSFGEKGLGLGVCGTWPEEQA